MQHKKSCKLRLHVAPDICDCVHTIQPFIKMYLELKSVKLKFVKETSLSVSITGVKQMIRFSTAEDWRQGSAGKCITEKWRGVAACSVLSTVNCLVINDFITAANIS